MFEHMRSWRRRGASFPVNPRPPLAILLASSQTVQEVHWLVRGTQRHISRRFMFRIDTHFNICKAILFSLPSLIALDTARRANSPRTLSTRSVWLHCYNESS